MSEDGIDFARLHESVEAARRPRPGQEGALKAGVRRALLELSRAQAAAQDPVNRGLTDALQRLAQTAATRDHIDELRVWLHGIEGRLAGIEGALEELRTWCTDLAGRIDELRGRQDAIATAVGRIEPYVAAARAVPDPATIGLEHFSDPEAGGVLGYRESTSGVGAQDDYLAFEDVFRLSEEVIRERQRPYLAVVGDRAPVLDVGCGRGEFLALLRDAGIAATGVDLDDGMVARARAKSLDVSHGDGIDYLRGLPDASLGVVFAAQVVEHLPYAQLMSFLRLCTVKLAPGGRLIAETVNPHAPGALKNFWFDLTHQHPVFPEVLITHCRSVGFARAFVFHPGGSGIYEDDRERCGDYALVAERAAG